jgi:hypothetical protein
METAIAGIASESTPESPVLVAESTQVAQPSDPEPKPAFAMCTE